MPDTARRRLPLVNGIGSVLCLLCAGCLAAGHCDQGCPPVPRELAKISLPPYVIEPPDILQLDAIRLIPRPPYKVEPLDLLAVRVTDTLPEQPIQGIYSVEPDGTIHLGFDYGTVRVVGLTLEQAQGAVREKLKGILKGKFDVTVSVAQSRALQQIRGPHLVHPDGTVSLGTYGSCYVDNLTISEAKLAIEAHLSQFLVNPEISLDVSGFNSKVYYVITDGGGYGEQVVRLPITGKTTVLDAVAQISGLPSVSSKKHIWLARPAPAGACGEQTLPVDWTGITQRGDTCTNYQVMAGDRIYVKAAALITFDAYLARFLNPVERAFGAVLLGNSTVRSFLIPIPKNTGVVTTGAATGTSIGTPGSAILFP